MKLPRERLLAARDHAYPSMIFEGPIEALERSQSARGPDPYPSMIFEGPIEAWFVGKEAGQKKELSLDDLRGPH